MRFLHVIERVGLRDFGDWHALACAAFCREITAVEHTVVLSGSRAEGERARRLGVEAGRLFAASTSWPLEAPGVRSIEMDRGPFDRVVHWGRSKRRFRSARRAPRSSFRLGWRAGDGAAVTLWDMEPEAAPLLGAPGLDDAAETRRVVRERLGLGDDEIVIVLAGHGDQARAGASFVFSLGLLECALRPLVGLMPATAGQTGRAERLQRPSKLPSRIVFSDEPELVLIAAADAVVICPRSWAFAAAEGDGRSDVDGAVFASAGALGVPVAAPASDRLRAIADTHGLQAELTHNGSRSEMARGLLAVLEREKPAPKPANAARFSESLLREILAH